jgi:subtilase family serine protease
MKTNSCIGGDFIQLGPAFAYETFNLTLWLPQKNFAAECPRLLEKVSNPCSEEYGQYYSFEEIRQYIYDAEVINIVLSYFKKKRSFQMPFNSGS